MSACHLGTLINGFRGSAVYAFVILAPLLLKRMNFLIYAFQITHLAALIMFLVDLSHVLCTVNGT